MNKREWKNFVAAKCPGTISRAWRESAAEYFYQDAKDARTEGDVTNVARQCIRLAGFLQERSAPPDPTRENRYLDRQPGVLAEWASITERLKAEIQRIREDYFGKPGPPFHGRYGDAVEWLRQTARKQHRPSAADREKARRLIDRARTLLRMRVTVEVDTLQYFRDDYPSILTGRLTVFDGSLLMSFANAVHSVVRDAGTAEPLVLDHVLTGFPLVPPLMRIETHDHLGVRMALTIHFPSAQSAVGVKASDLHRLLGLRRVKKLSDKERQFFEEVVRKGGPPQRDDHGYWQGLAERHGLGSRKAAKNKFRRLQGRLHY